MVGGASTFTIMRGLLRRDDVENAHAAAQSFFATAWDDHMGDLARLQNGVALTWTNALKSGEVASLRDFMGRLAALLPSNDDDGLIFDCTSLRRQSPQGTPLPWHQDACPMRTENMADGYVVWVPLVPIDDATPSLEFMPGPHPVMPHAPGTNGFAELALPIDGETARCPALEPGDVLVFGLNAVHRTYIPEGAARERYSCDVRIGTGAYLAAHPDHEVLPCG